MIGLLYLQCGFLFMPFVAAKWSGVLPSLSLALMFAPVVMSALMKLSSSVKLK